MRPKATGPIPRFAWTTRIRLVPSCLAHDGLSKVLRVVGVNAAIGEPPRWGSQQAAGPKRRLRPAITFP
jgi:hypothetical protein